MKKDCPGFTLVELLVSISVVAILSGIGLAAFSSFNRRQIVASATRQLVSDLRLAQSKADSNEKPTACQASEVDLLGYEFIIETANRHYKITPVCALSPPLPSIKTVDIPGVIRLACATCPNPNDNVQIFFKTLRQGVASSGFNSESKLTITLTGYGATRSATLTSSGEIYSD
jgi:prepilin-type N-terminal cleavage/methylation domain-containing protein